MQPANYLKLKTMLNNCCDITRYTINASTRPAGLSKEIKTQRKSEQKTSNKKWKPKRVYFVEVFVKHFVVRNSQ